jgi:hypothetical protein
METTQGIRRSKYEHIGKITSFLIWFENPPKKRGIEEATVSTADREAQV